MLLSGHCAAAEAVGLGAEIGKHCGPMRIFLSWIILIGSQEDASLLFQYRFGRPRVALRAQPWCWPMAETMVEEDTVQDTVSRHDVSAEATAASGMLSKWC